MATPVDRLLAKLPDAKQAGKGWSARCPAHEDGRASLSIAEGDDGRALVHCHAGCTADAICAAVGLRVQARVNGVVKQDSRTGDMIFDVPTLIAFVSEYMTLEVGDVISTGTPSGVGNLSVGDVCEIEIEGVGVLRNPVVARE